jgi:hypothetical protein
VPHHLPHQKLIGPTLPFSLALGSFHYLSCDQNHVTFIGWHSMASHVMNNMLATLHTTITSNVTLWTMKLHECMWIVSMACMHRNMDTITSITSISNFLLHIQ